MLDDDSLPLQTIDPPGRTSVVAAVAKMQLAGNSKVRVFALGFRVVAKERRHLKFFLIEREKKINELNRCGRF